MSRERRCWLTFSLKSLFVLILIVAAYFAGWRSALWIAEREKEEAVRKAVEELEALQDQESPRVVRMTAPPSEALRAAMRRIWEGQNAPHSPRSDVEVAPTTLPRQ